MLYLWRHNVFRVESCSCIEKSGKLEVSREQDVTRTPMGAGRLLLIANGLPEPSIRKPATSHLFLFSENRANTVRLGSKILSQAAFGGKGDVCKRRLWQSFQSLFSSLF